MKSSMKFDDIFCRHDFSGTDKKLIALIRVYSRGKHTQATMSILTAPVNDRGRLRK